MRFCFIAATTAITSGIPSIEESDIRSFLLAFNWSDAYHFQLLMNPNNRANKTWTRSGNQTGWSTWHELQCRTVLSGITRYDTVIVGSNVNLGDHIKLNGLDNGFYKIFIHIQTNDFLSYNSDNNGDMGFCMRWDSNDILFVMYSFMDKKIYWQSCSGNTWTGWREL